MINKTSTFSLLVQLRTIIIKLPKFKLIKRHLLPYLGIWKLNVLFLFPYISLQSRTNRPVCWRQSLYVRQAPILERWLSLTQMRIKAIISKVFLSKNVQLELTKYCWTFTPRYSNDKKKFIIRWISASRPFKTRFGLVFSHPRHFIFFSCKSATDKLFSGALAREARLWSTTGK